MEIIKANQESNYSISSQAGQILQAMSSGCVHTLTREALERMIMYLNRLVGARYKDSIEQSESNNFLLIKIMQDFKNTKVEEIHLAFELAVKGKLNIEVYRILDYKAFCDVMLAYEEYKKDNRFSKPLNNNNNGNNQSSF